MGYSLFWCALIDLFIAQDLESQSRQTTADGAKNPTVDNEKRHGSRKSLDKSLKSWPTMTLCACVPDRELRGWRRGEAEGGGGGWQSFFNIRH